MKKTKIIQGLMMWGVFLITSLSCSQADIPVIRQDLVEEEVLDPVNTSVETISKDTLRVPVVHHISRRDNGTNPSVTNATIQSVLNVINDNYKTAKIQFYTKAIKNIDNSAWNLSFSKQDDFRDKRVLKPFEDDKALNLFYFNRITSNGNGIGATALFPDEGNNVKFSSSTVDASNTATATHEIGHYLGLYHIDDDFRDSQGRIELVDGSNCAVAGDKICDTPASPVLNDGNTVDCFYVGNEKDPNGVAYNPDIYNFMMASGRTRADSQGLCRREFSKGQIDKMTTVLNNERSYLITR